MSRLGILIDFNRELPGVLVAKSENIHFWPKYLSISNRDKTKFHTFRILTSSQWIPHLTWLNNTNIHGYNTCHESWRRQPSDQRIYGLDSHFGSQWKQPYRHISMLFGDCATSDRFWWPASRPPALAQVDFLVFIFIWIQFRKRAPARMTSSLARPTPLAATASFVIAEGSKLHPRINDPPGSNGMLNLHVLVFCFVCSGMDSSGSMGRLYPFCPPGS